MMPLLFSKFTHMIHKLERLAEIGEFEGLRDVVFFDDVPPIDLLLKCGEILTFERRRPYPARNARLGRKARHLRSYSITRPRDAQSTSFSGSERRE